MWLHEARSYLEISSSSWKTEEISSKGALKLEVPKMPKVEEFYLFIIKDVAPPGAHAA